LPKRRRVPPVIRPGSRKTTGRWDEERRSQLLVMALGAVVVIAVAGIAVFGYYQTQIRPKGETVLQVGDRSFNLDYVERRLRYDISQGNTTYEASPSQAASLLLDEIGKEELMRQGAPEKGVDLSEEAVDAEIRSRENVAADADQNTFAAAYRKAVRDSGLSTKGYRDVVAADMANKALESMFQEQAPKTADQVRFRVIVLATEDDAKAALQRLQNGEDFATVAQEVSLDSTSSANGGEVDWTVRGLLDPALDEALFSLDIGQISDIITGQNGLFIVQVEERQEQRETTSSQQVQLGDKALQDWLSQLGDSLGVATSLNDSQRASILKVLQSEASKGQ
jgi:peptidyl-prolyl cis-trans isomerase SurA